MATRAHHYYTPEEYLALECAAEYKSEYLDGVIYAVAGAGEPHNQIVSNIHFQLRLAFQGRPCRVYTSDMRVLVQATGLQTYPDVVAFCGSGEFADDKRDTLLNPSVIMEVLSPSTEGYDRGAKSAHYWKIPSLTDYVLVTQNQMRVEHITRHPDGWLVAAHTEPDAVLTLPVLATTSVLATIYENVAFPPPPKPGLLRPPRVRIRPTPPWPEE